MFGRQVQSTDDGQAAVGGLSPAATPAAGEAVPRHRHVLFWSIALGGATFDLITKWLVFSAIGQPPAPPRHLIDGVLDLRTSFNSGALWGMGRGWPNSSLIFALLSVAAAVCIYWYLFVRGAAVSRPLTASLALIMAGALGNCYDRLLLGQVRDFVHFHVDAINFDFPIFNFADNMLVLGAAALMLLALRPDPLHAPAPEQAPPPQAQT